ncbi:hypothetical protein ACGF0J_21455 [Nonomuraea sp. NPDC047897]|uniref:hypothetical protein n=1 Tax=Nonomuraea sp. NPDC047897 TaxID=3364346 RepID=UPI0037210A40
MAIVEMLHSPARTRDFDRLLLGRCGTVAGVLRNGTLALVALDGADDELPGGVRRWSVHWDDLDIDTTADGWEKLAESYGLGLSGPDREAVYHAVPADWKISLCGKPVRHLSILGWPMPFAPTATRACRACLHLAEQPPHQASVRAS